MLHSHKKTALIAIALVTLVAGGLIAFFVPTSHESGSSSGSHTIFIALLPIYTSLIAVFAARRRRNKKTDG